MASGSVGGSRGKAWDRLRRDPVFWHVTHAFRGRSDIWGNCLRGDGLLDSSSWVVQVVGTRCIQSDLRVRVQGSSWLLSDSLVPSLHCYCLHNSCNHPRCSGSRAGHRGERTSLPRRQSDWGQLTSHCHSTSLFPKKWIPKSIQIIRFSEPSWDFGESWVGVLINNMGRKKRDFCLWKVIIFLWSFKKTGSLVLPPSRNSLVTFCLKEGLEIFCVGGFSNFPCCTGPLGSIEYCSVYRLQWYRQVSLMPALVFSRAGATAPVATCVHTSTRRSYFHCLCTAVSARISVNVKCFQKGVLGKAREINHDISVT